MKLNKIIFHQNNIFGNKEFSLSKAEKINTISGINGSGKSTLFSSVVLVQKAFFCEELEEEELGASIGEEDLPFGDVRHSIEREAYKYFCRKGSYIGIDISFDDGDFKLLKTKKRDLKNDSIVDNNLKDINLKLICKNIYNESVLWKIECSTEERMTLKKFWNINNPICIFVYFPAERIVFEDDMRFENVSMAKQGEYSNKLRIIFDSGSLYNGLYKTMMNDYVSQRIVPLKPAKDKYIRDARVKFSKIMSDLEVSNFSGTTLNDQIIIMGKQNRIRYDLRNFSSGEKLIWYSMLLISYIANMGVLIIDEPENHLHENLLWKFVLFLKNACDGNEEGITLGQVFLLTHSRDLITNNFDLGSNFVLNNKELKLLESCEADDIFANLGISFSTNHVLFVEGNTDSEVFECYFSDSNVKVVKLNGCHNIYETFRTFSNINEYIHDHNFVFLTDRDTQDDDEIKSLSKRNGFDGHFVILDRHEIENYFLDSENIAEAYNQLAKDIGIDRIDKADIEIKMREFADNCKDNVKKKYINSVC